MSSTTKSSLSHPDLSSNDGHNQSSSSQQNQQQQQQQQHEHAREQEQQQPQQMQTKQQQPPSQSPPSTSSSSTREPQPSSRRLHAMHSKSLPNTERVRSDASSSSLSSSSSPQRSKQRIEPSTMTAASRQDHDNNDWTVTDTLEEKIGKPGREALHNFFYPPSNNRSSNGQNPPTPPRPQVSSSSSPQNNSLSRNAQQQQRLQEASSSSRQHQNIKAPTSTSERRGNPNTLSPLSANKSTRQPPPGPQRQPIPSDPPLSPTSHQSEFDDHFRQQEQDDIKFVSDFWKIYDDLIILSIFTQLGIVARLGSSLWFSFFDGVFSNDSPLFVNLPLNCLSCFILGMLCSGESCMEIITTRFSPPRLQQQIHTDKRTDDSESHNNHNDDDDEDLNDGDHHVANDHESGRTTSPNQRGGAGSGPSSPPNNNAARGSPVVGRLSSEDSADANSSFDDIHWDSHQGGGFFRRRRRGGGARGTRRSKYEKQTRRLFNRVWQPPAALNEELRDVQLLALERRIRQSKCLLLFPVNKEDVDVMEHYFDEGYKRGLNRQEEEHFGGENGMIDDDDMNGLFLEESYEDDDVDAFHASEANVRQPSTARHSNPMSDANRQQHQPSALRQSDARSNSNRPQPQSPPSQRPSASNSEDPLQSSGPPVTPPATANPQHSQGASDQPPVVELHGEVNPTDLNQIVHEVSANVTENMSRLRRVNLANGWDVGTSADDMSDDIILGFRFGFCGALSSFSSWNSAMINLIRRGKIGDAFVGYMLGLQLPIIAYRFGQYIAVYVFVWRCRQETKRDERRGYGIQLHTQGDDDDEENNQNNNDHDEPGHDRRPDPATEDGQTPSIRAIITVIFVMALVTQCTSISFYSEPQNQVVALSLLFSPLGVLARWRLSRYNEWRPTFPIGTFTCNMLACALSGGLGRLLAGNPNEEERLVLVSFINGFGGTLSSVANFIVEILAGMDPILFRFDGAVYALWSIAWAMVIGFVFSASADWADDTG
ncbi:hypothetical protein ACA910_017071 [Epithemia clementina (nom. ined.)]